MICIAWIVDGPSSPPVAMMNLLILKMLMNMIGSLIAQIKDVKIMMVKVFFNMTPNGWEEEKKM